MAKLGQRFDATAHDTEQRAEYEDLPAGIYQFEVEASEVVETGEEHARTGSGMKYTANVLAPPELAGKKFFGFINLENINAQAQEIGQRELASMCRAMGVDGADDTEELHFHTYTAKLGMGKPSKKVHPVGHPQAGQPRFPARMEVKRYFYPDEGDVPEAEIDAIQPVKVAAPANDNRVAANTNTAAKPAAAAGARPWSKAK